ncbi:PEP-CTERM/exosortase system-associated acyltransferase [Chromatocurvus halotolerans]|uniref:N-acyl amino acid synthase of PEP-CTERM/exosortase system n=1 Tax=Chromatocurvus halotolerans TaxID=1132028 RepID=A0A4R2KTC6_9GAMM|nr:PEP-CTERM/exosortase system-associated acyltransferase [Chromatocurvus halotolerans]TCO74336.1 N-acyl amino acid synthase of PEP-CTERM/exosortase system [Chromatocurvus halotolerans]
MGSETESAGTSSLFMEFARYFELSLALTPAEKEAVYAVRYRVYCEEFGYEPIEAFLDRQETDEFDNQSAHCLVTHKETGRPAGCVRLVFVEGDNRLPMELHSGGAIDADFMRRFDQTRGEICEISRLAVDGAFRRRRGEDASQFGAHDSFLFNDEERRTFPLIAVALFLASAAVADIQSRPNLFAIMEPFLPKILGRIGVQFQRVGEDFQFRGVRAPYYANINDLVRDIPDDLRLCYDAVKAQFIDVLYPGESMTRQTAEAGSRGVSATQGAVSRVA